MNRDRPVVWETTLDKRYKCTVYRDGTHTGELVIDDADGELIGCVSVPLAYGAIFGPDVADIRLWQLYCAEFIDTSTGPVKPVIQHS